MGRSLASCPPRHPGYLPNAATASFVDDLLALTVEERRALPYMHPGRADVIGAGALIWSRILDRVPVFEHVVSEADILHAMAAAIAR
jgi:exopolyphosphatase/guanosine-5'-triphosphate,3'-diphosphate pyrophosphatase